MIGETKLSQTIHPDYEQRPLGRGSFPKCSQGRNLLYLSIEPKTINSVFSGINLSLFSNIQVWMSNSP